jgi:hypothetical protein
MHQAVAETVSYSEVILRDEEIKMHYKPGPLCLNGTVYAATLRAGSAVIGD